MSKRRVVITGVGAVCSLGYEIQEIWQKLLNKESGVSQITKFNPEKFMTQIAAEVKTFPTDCIEARDLRRLDLFSQYALVAANKAIKDAKLEIKEGEEERVGVILGSGMGGMTEVQAQQNVIKEKGPRRIPPYFVPKLMINAASAEICIRHGFKGVSYTTSSACSSSAHAIGNALKSIQYDEMDIVISGGSEAVITELAIAGFASARALSKRNDEPEKACRPFDKTRDGFVMGEGSGILVLEEYERAKARGAHIYAELIGVGWNTDAHHITQPSPEGIGALKAMELALKNANINPDMIDYINAHGTSTPQNDKTETKAIKSLLGEKAYKIPISSSKSMIGHMLGAAGGMEAIITAKSIDEQTVHATANYETPDPECDLDYVVSDARKTEINYALSNSFGFGGHNVCLVFAKI